MKKKYDKRNIAIKTSDQSEEIVDTNGLLILTFSSSTCRRRMINEAQF